MKKTILILACIAFTGILRAATVVGQYYAFFNTVEATKTLEQAKEACKAIFSGSSAADKYYKPANKVSRQLIKEEYRLNMSQALGVDASQITDEMAIKLADSFQIVRVKTEKFYSNGITSPYVSPTDPEKIAGSWVPKNREEENLVTLFGYPIFSMYCGQNPQIPPPPDQPISPDENPPMAEKPKDSLPDMSWTRTPISGGNSTSSASSSISAPVSYTYIAPPQQASSGSGVDLNTLLMLDYLSNARNQQQRQGSDFWTIAGGTALGSTFGTTAGNFLYDWMSGGRRRQNNYVFQQRNNNYSYRQQRRGNRNWNWNNNSGGSRNNWWRAGQASTDTWSAPFTYNQYGQNGGIRAPKKFNPYF